ncbi:ABC transporter permease [Actinoplanes sp. SE50]|uniref:carbohydrate ABC transporter permease n=1 Tax=unclassified Actinoplanes TaxID=2626549 RepID=UPI00023EC282|nr:MULTISPECIES: sugar ABC transporter permease [unclassified Actinoplanes]AEV84095.1 Maltose transport system permease protein malF [Actinoplanes sp. SE50/110]ATO82487.1 ABC transporter permease [Actinoplanes sp. SE50]SLL99894.1 ABC transporter permease [Actinoplanes sp. SE50/110]
MRGRRPFIAAFLIPSLLLYGVFVVSPYAQAFPIAGTDWAGLSPSYDFVGLDNFRRLLGDAYFWTALRHNGLLLVLLPVVTITLGLFFASMISVGGRGDRAGIHGVRGSGFYRVVYFFPQVLSVAIVGVLWKQMYGPNTGLVNGTLRAIGLERFTTPWLGDPRFAFWCVFAVLVWMNVGFYVVLFSAAMQAVPRDLYEAALLDGANRLTTLVRLTVPLLWDTIQVAWVYLAIIAMDGFAIVQLVTDGGPGSASDVVGLRLYRTAFGDGRFGYASAIGVAMFFLTLTVAAMFLRVTRRETVEL